LLLLFPLKELKLNDLPVVVVVAAADAVVVDDNDLFFAIFDFNDDILVLVDDVDADKEVEEEDVEDPRCGVPRG
jgi:hypothetical protein